MTSSRRSAGGEWPSGGPNRSKTRLQQGFDADFDLDFDLQTGLTQRIFNTFRKRVAPAWALRGVAGWAGATPVIGRLGRPDLFSSPEGSARVAPAHPTTVELPRTQNPPMRSDFMRLV